MTIENVIGNVGLQLRARKRSDLQDAALQVLLWPASVSQSVSDCLCKNYRPLIDAACHDGQPFYYMAFACCIEICIMRECTRSK